ncbi:hypothetical protein LAUMK13_03933 [Mycobacterium innocens]|uniref:Uncharacterized protein n=1 Tax=Mycobacterium innocens TaxID=2341083 RepID=A0A498Q9M8_9MYCO|nr:hypothetical protein LAUMK13_03933 [Mycobacterium innocens]
MSLRAFVQFCKTADAAAHASSAYRVANRRGSRRDAGPSLCDVGLNAFRAITQFGIDSGAANVYLGAAKEHAP